MLRLRWPFIIFCTALAAFALQPQINPTLTAAPLSSPGLRTQHIPTGDLSESATFWPPPLTADAIEGCPITRPNHKSPADGVGTSSFNLGNKNETIFTILWPGGKIIFSPNGPGSKNPDGSLGMKWPWYRSIAGDVVITRRRLDAPAPSLQPIVLRGNEDGYGETGFHPSGLLFSSEGCWEVTAAVGEERLTFVTLVVRIDFDPPHFGRWLPNSPNISDVDVSGWPDSIRQIRASPTGEKIIVETAQTREQTDAQFPTGSIGRVSVNDRAAICVHGERGKNGVWRRQADRVLLRWWNENLAYSITAAGLKLRCADLLQIANSQL